MGNLEVIKRQVSWCRDQLDDDLWLLQSANYNANSFFLLYLQVIVGNLYKADKLIIEK